MPKRFFSQSGMHPGWGGAKQQRFGGRVQGFAVPRATPVQRPRPAGRGVAGFQRTAGYYGRFGPGAKGDAGPELKFHDLDIDQDPPATAGTIAEDSCVTIAQDMTESTRIGRKCVIRSINWRFRIVKKVSTAAADTSDVCRVILYLDKQCNGVTAAVTDILESADFQSFNNLANKSRFRTLMDREYALNSCAGGGDGTTEDYGENVTIDSFFKNCNIPIEYDNSATTGAIATVRSNNIGVLLISQDAKCSFSSKMRLRFSDSG